MAGVRVCARPPRPNPATVLPWESKFAPTDSGQCWWGGEDRTRADWDTGEGGEGGLVGRLAQEWGMGWD